MTIVFPAEPNSVSVSESICMGFLREFRAAVRMSLGLGARARACLREFLAAARWSLETAWLWPLGAGRLFGPAGSTVCFRLLEALGAELVLGFGGIVRAGK